MNPFDMRTVLFSYVISNAICTVVMAVLWLQNRKYFAGLGFWLAAVAMPFVGLGLVILRGVVPDWVSIVVGNTLSLGGMVMLYEGLGRFERQRVAQIHNIILLGAFAAMYTYYMLAQPNLAARSIILSVGVLVVCSQSAWLMLRRVDAATRWMTRAIGLILVGYCLNSLIRIVIVLVVPPGNDFFHEAGPLDTLVVMAYHMLSVALTFGLSLLVSHRLQVDLECDIAARQQVEGALRLSEEKYLKAFHSSPDAVLITRLVDGRIIEVNEGFGRITGYSREEALASSTLALNLWANLQDRDAMTGALRKNKRARDLEYDFVTKSGQRIRGLYSGEIIDLGGEAHALSVVRDITERKRAEAALQAEREFTERALNTQLDTFFVFNPQTGKAQRWNQAFRDISGYSDEEIAQLKAPDAYYAPSDLEKAAQAIQLILERGAGTIELEFICKDGRRVPFEYVASVMHDASGEPSLISIGRNIAERKRTEEIIRLRLRLSEFAANHSLDELMQKALDDIGEITHSPIGFYHFVEADQKTLSLQAWSTRTEREFCKAEGKGAHYSIDQAGVWVDCVHQRKPVIHNDYAALSHRKGMPPGHAEVQRELVVPTMRAGRIVSILGIGNKPSEYDEQDIELVAYVADIVWTIVERKQAQEALRQSAAQLAAQNAELDAFAHTAAHNLLNPLGILAVASQLLAEDLADVQDEHMRATVNIMVRTSSKMSITVNELLLLASVREMGQVERSLLDMGAIVAGAQERLMVKITGQQAEIILPSTWPAAVGYAPWIEEVWANYMDNAIKYGGRPPRVELGADLVPITSTPLAGSQESGQVRFWVRDNGKGLSEQDRVHLFTPFERLSQTYVEGHGLGLSIVQRIIERLGGQVGVESEPGQGSTFFFTLPTGNQVSTDHRGQAHRGMGAEWAGRADYTRGMSRAGPM